MMHLHAKSAQNCFISLDILIKLNHNINLHKSVS